jgi:hypothetical protein
MKKILSLFCMVALIFIMATACAVSLKSLKPCVDTNTIFKVVDTLTSVDANGFKVLSIPDKEFAKNKIEFIIFKHPVIGNYGYGLVGDNGNSALLYDMPTQAWIFCQDGFCTPISEEDAKRLEKEFLELLYEKGDFAKAGPFKTRTKEVKGLEV